MKSSSIAAVWVAVASFGFSACSGGSSEWTYVVGPAVAWKASGVTSEDFALADLEVEQLPEQSPAPQAIPAPRTIKKPRAPITHVSCSQGGDKRVLEIVRHRAGCQLAYRKNSRSEIVAEAVWGNKVCGQVQAKIMERLKSSGYRCT